MLKAPSWCPHAIPTLAGWEDPHSGEVLKTANHTRQQVAEWHGISVEMPAPKPAPEPVVQTLHEAPTTETTVSEPQMQHYYGQEEE